MKKSTRKRLIAVPVLAAMWCLTPVWAADKTLPEPIPAPIGGSEIANLGTGLALVIGAILLCGWIYSRSRGLKGHAGDVFNILASQALGPKERILLVEVANKQLVIGMTATQVQTLHVFDERVVEDAKPGGQVSFANRLKSAFGVVRK